MVSGNKENLTELEEQILCLRNHILWAAFDEGGVVFNLENRFAHEVNHTGVMILQLLDGQRNVKKVLHDFAQLCGQPEDVVKQDAINFFKNIIKRDWVYVK